MLRRVLADYGGPFVDARVVSNPQSQISADRLNRALEDAAQLSITGFRAVVGFLPTADAAPATVASGNVSVWSVWGSGSSQKPVITKTATGLYTLTFPTPFTDSLGVEETVAFVGGHGSAVTTTNTLDSCKIKTISANVVTVVVFTAAVVNDFANGTAFVWLI